MAFWLSILVPVYNVRPWLHECLQSVMEQCASEDGVQVLALDDCSTDGCSELLYELARRWPGRLQLLRHERNSGLSAARNTLIEAAVGDYLWFLDSDDWLLAGAIASLRAIVQEHAPDVVLCDFALWREKPQLKHRLRGEDHRRSFRGPARQLVHDRCTLLSGMLATGELHAWSKISRRALWMTNLRFPLNRYFEDMATMPLMALRADSFYYEPHPWVAYRQRASSILATMTPAKALDQSDALLPLSLALRSTECGSNVQVQQALAHQASRCLIGAMSYLCRHGSEVGWSEPPLAVAQRLRENYLRISPLDSQALARHWLQRGWWLRRYRFLHWFHARPAP